MEFWEKIADIQYRLKAPKNQYNSFGEYKYRSLEDILEAVKPLLHEHGLVMHIDDDVVTENGETYVMATAVVRDERNSFSNRAYARESREKKKLDASQLTGVASSYARKYALNGLFLIDDTKDADTDAFAKQNGEKTPAQAAEDEKKRMEAVANAKIGEARAQSLRAQLLREKIPEKIVLELYKVNRLSDLTEKKHADIFVHLDELRAAANDRVES